jgi:hypothetical protein
MVGIYPFAPARVLALVRPRLPSWLPSLTVSNVRVGDAVVSLRFIRVKVMPSAARLRVMLNQLGVRIGRASNGRLRLHRCGGALQAPYS